MFKSDSFAMDKAKASDKKKSKIRIIIGLQVLA
jgi:hypothetical protein